MNDERRDAELEGLANELLERYEELTLLYGLSADLSVTLDVDALCQIALDRALEVLRASHGGVVLREEDGLRLRAAHEGAPFEVASLLSENKTIAGEVIRSGRPVVRHPHDADPGESDVRDPSQPALAVPLLPAREGPAFGAISLLRAGGAPQFTASDLQLAQAIASQLAVRIETSSFVRDLQEAERAQREVELAATVQRSLLPALPRELDGLRIEARSLPAAEVGGDLYDLVTDEEGCVWLLVADVTGHGIGSALMMAGVRAVLRLELRDRTSPAEALVAANATLYAELVRAELLVTALCARWERLTGRLTIANAAHLPALVRRRDGSVEQLDADGTPLGLIEGAAYEELTTTLDRGDILLLYTDGVVEARDSGDRLLGDERLLELVRATSDPESLVRSVLAAVDAQLEGAPSADDVTLLAVTPT